MLIRPLFALLFLALPALPALAQDGSKVLRPGIGAKDPRLRVDPQAPPWRAVGKLQAVSGNLRGLCTGTLVGPATVLTAAHCVINPKTGHPFPPGAMHFLIGFQSGDFTHHAVGTRLTVAPDYDPAARPARFGSDWALLELDARIGSPDRILAIAAAPPAPGTPVMIGGYSQDHPLLLMVDKSCHVTGHLQDGRGHLLLEHDCAATHGDSGAPVLAQEGGAWRVVGITVGANSGAGGIAALPAEARKRLSGSR